MNEKKTQTRKKQPYTLRRLMFDVHLYAGLGLGLLLLVTGLTGSAVVFRDEIEAAVMPAMMRVEPQGAMLTPPQILAAAEAAYPQMQARNLHLPLAADRAAEVIFKPRSSEPHDEHKKEQMQGEKKTEAPNTLVYVNPYTGAVLGARQREGSWMKWLVDLHVKLLAGHTGETVVGIGGLLLALLGVTGLWVWWPRQGQAFGNGFKVKFGANWKRVNYDLHKAGGVFALVLLTLTALTGAGMAFGKTTEKLIYALTGTPPRLEPVRVIKPENATPQLLSDLIAKAEIALPGGQLTRIHLPDKATDAVRVRKRMDGEWRINGHSQSYLDPFTGAVLRVEDARQFPVGQRVMRALYPLHTGEWGGLFFRVLQVVIGLAPGFFFVTGFLMWWNRVMVKKLRHAPPPAVLQTPLIGRASLPERVTAES